MDENQGQFFRMQQFDVPKMPFYMSYPIQNLYLTEMEYEKDMDRMKELYPKEVRRILEAVEEECDKMEYEGSLMFDEYPDRLMVGRVTERIYRKVTEEDGGEIYGTQMFEPQMPGAQMPLPPDGRPPQEPPGPGMPPYQGNPVKNLIGVILSNEMYRRRCRHRRCRRWW